MEFEREDHSVEAVNDENLPPNSAINSSYGNRSVLKELNSMENDKMSPLPSKTSSKLAASPTPVAPSSKPNCDFLKGSGDENSNQQSPKLVGLPEFDEATIPDLPRSLNANLEDQLRLTFDGDYPSLPESVNSNSNPSSPIEKVEINNETIVCSRGENNSDGDMENGEADDISKALGDTKPQDMKLSSDSNQISTISSANVSKPDISYDELAMDIELECKQSLEDDFKNAANSLSANPNLGSSLEANGSSENSIERPKSRLTFCVEPSSIASKEDSLDTNKRETYTIPTIESPIVNDIVNQEVKGRRTFNIESDRLNTETPKESNPIKINVLTDDTTNANTTRPQTPSLTLNDNEKNEKTENLSRPETPTMDIKLNSTLDMTSSFLSAKSSAGNSPSFPVKQSTTNTNMFPRSPASKGSRKMPFLEKSNYDETNLDNILPIVDNSVEDEFSKPISFVEPLHKTNTINEEDPNEENKRRTFTLTSPPKQISNSFPLTSSIDLDDDLDLLNKRRTFCINSEENKDIISSSEDKRRTFICNDETFVNKNDEVASFGLEGGYIQDEFEPMDVDESMVENQSKLLNQTCEMIELPSPNSHSLPTLQKRQAIEIPPAVDIIPLPSPSLLDATGNGNLKGTNPKETSLNSKLSNVEINSSFTKEEKPSVPGSLTRGETFTIEPKISKSKSLPIQAEKTNYSPPVPLLEETFENLSNSAEQYNSASPPIPTLAKIKQNTEDKEKFVSSSPPLPAMVQKSNSGEKDENLESDLAARPQQLSLKQEDNSNDLKDLPDVVTPTLITNMIKQEEFTTPESFESFRSSPKPMPIICKKEEEQGHDQEQGEEQEQEFHSPESLKTFTSNSPPIPTIQKRQELSNLPPAAPPLEFAPIQALPKRKSFDDVLEKQQMSPAQVAKIQKRRPLHQNQKQNPNIFKIPAIPLDQNLSAKEKSSKDEKEYFEKRYTQSSLDEVFNSNKFENVSNDPDGNNLSDFDDDFRNAESNIILNPSDFEYLLTKGNNNAPINRNSLLLRFDPLLGAPTFINQPQQQQQQLNQINSLIPTVTEEDESHHQHQHHSYQHKTQNQSQKDSSSETTKKVEGNSGPNSESGSNETSKESSSVIAGQPGGGGGGGVAEVSSSLGSTKSISKKANAIMSADVIKDISIDSDSNKCFDNSNIQSDEKKLNYNMDELEKKIQNEVSKMEDIEKKLKESELREEALIKRITDKDKTINKMNGVIEAYEKTIGELISEKEQVSQNFEKELMDVKADRDSYYRHLTSLEATFADLHIKYEKSKEMTLQLKANEELLLTEKKQHLENLRLLEQRYDKMKNHAMQQLEIANKTLETLTKEHQMETTKLKAQLKKEAVANASLNEQLQQKTRENAELFKICDELINGQQGS